MAAIPILLVGKNQEIREAQAKTLAKEFSEDPFDTHVINAISNGGIDTIREIIAMTPRRPFRASYSTFIINNAQYLTTEAQNAFLKTLEEPPPHTRIILTAITKHSMLSTIFSRCEVIDLGSGIEDLESITNNDIIFFNRYFDKSFFEQINNISAFDLDTWIKVWRKVLRAKILDQGASKTFSKLKTVEIKNYLKEILLVKAAMDKKVNQKLAFLKLMSDLLIFN